MQNVPEKWACAVKPYRSQGGFFCIRVSKLTQKAHVNDTRGFLVKQSDNLRIIGNLVLFFKRLVIIQNREIDQFLWEDEVLDEVIVIALMKG